MFKEYEVIRLKNNLNKIEANSRGTILLIYDGQPPKYEVEFMDEKGKSVGLETVSEDQLEPAD